MEAKPSLVHSIHVTLMTSKHYDPPREIKDLKQEKLWDWGWCRTTFPGDTEFDFHILEKHKDGYSVHASTSNAVEAFTIRKQLVADGVCQKPFVRAKKRRQVFAEHNYEDAYRDALRTGDDSFIPAHLHEDFNNWASQQIRERQAYRRNTVDRPRFGQ